MGKDLSVDAIDDQSDNNGIESIEILQNDACGFMESTMDAPKGNQPRGQPEIVITMEDLYCNL